MNEKISFQDIADAISEKGGVTKKLSEDFLREFVAVIEVALQKDGVAKIKGLGTFKLQLVEERKSVNVQTGAEIVIPAHQKVSFAPEKSLKEAVNKPFAHLETYVLKNEGPVDPEPVETDDDEVSVAETDSPVAENVTVPPVQVAAKQEEEQVAEEAAAESNAQNNAQEAEPQAVEPQKEERLSVEPEVAVESENVAANSEVAEVAEAKGEEPELKEVSSEPEVSEPAANNSDAVTESVAPAVEDKAPEKPVAKAAVGEEKSEEQKNKTLGYIILAFVVLCIFAITVIWYTDRSFFKKICNPGYNPIEVGCDKAPAINVKPKEEVAPAAVADSLAADTLAADSAALKAKVDSVAADSIVADSAAVAADTAAQSKAEEAQPQVAEVKPEAKPEKPSVKYDRNFKPEFIEYMKAKHPNVSLETKGVKKLKVAKGQRLTTIALNNYGDKNYWVYLYLYNYKVIKNPNSVSVGMKLLVPKLDKSLVDGTNPKTMELASEVRKVFVEK